MKIVTMFELSLHNAVLLFENWKLDIDTLKAAGARMLGRTARYIKPGQSVGIYWLTWLETGGKAFLQSPEAL